MKNNILYFVILLMILMMGCMKDDSVTTPNLSQGEWKIIRNADTLNRFSGLYFVDRMNGWAIGYSGVILHTSDGGDSWNAQESGTTASLKCIYFANAQKGWIGGGNNSIGMTTNGGITWVWQNPAGEPRRTYMSMSFVDDRRGWVVDNFSGILHTEDGGMTWIPQISGTTWAITSVQFLDAQEGWATTTNLEVLHTTNGGNNWIKTDLSDINYGYGVVVVYIGIFFLNRYQGWIATMSVSSIANSTAPIVRTQDAGNTWICQPSPDSWISSIQFTSEKEGWASGINGILHTHDGGIRWFYEIEKPSAKYDGSGLFNGLFFVDQLHGWAITFTGNIYRYQAQ